MTGQSRLYPLFILLALAALVILAAGCTGNDGGGSPAPAPTTPSIPATAPGTTTTATPATLPAGNQTVTVDLIAKNIAFNLQTITVPAGATVIVNFHNQDPGIPHNFAVYETSSSQTAIFRGKIINGPEMITYTFIAPSTPGTYFFRCDVHPTQMTGWLVVQ